MLGGNRSLRRGTGRGRSGRARRGRNRDTIIGRDRRAGGRIGTRRRRGPHRRAGTRPSLVLGRCLSLGGGRPSTILLFHYNSFCRACVRSTRGTSEVLNVALAGDDGAGSPRKGPLTVTNFPCRTLSDCLPGLVHTNRQMTVYSRLTPERRRRGDRDRRQRRRARRSRVGQWVDVDGGRTCTRGCTRTTVRRVGHCNVPTSIVLTRKVLRDDGNRDRLTRGRGGRFNVGTASS